MCVKSSHNFSIWCHEADPGGDRQGQHSDPGNAGKPHSGGGWEIAEISSHQPLRHQEHPAEDGGQACHHPWPEHTLWDGGETDLLLLGCLWWLIGPLRGMKNKGHERDLDFEILLDLNLLKWCQIGQMNEFMLDLEHYSLSCERECDKSVVMSGDVWMLSHIGARFIS